MIRLDILEGFVAEEVRVQNQGAKMGPAGSLRGLVVSGVGGIKGLERSYSDSEGHCESLSQHQQNRKPAYPALDCMN